MIEARGLTVTFRNAGGVFTAVKDASFSVGERETFGIVGESGSGKSTVLRALAGLQPASAGDIWVAGRLMARRRGQADRKLMQMVFQDPYGSLHPRQTVDDVLREPLAIAAERGAEEKIAAMLVDVGLSPQHRFRYPHQLSGGQRQRVAIARALILRPPILLLDEPTSALNVSIQAEILNLLSRLKREYSLTAILVSHDLGVVSHLCQRLAIMREGRIVEQLSVAELRAGAAKEAYTRDLIAASKGFVRA